MIKMKKEVKRLGISTSMVLMVMVLFGSLFSSCYTKDDLPVVPEQESKEPATYTVNVTVLGPDGALEGVRLYPMNGTTDANGKYTYTQNGSGNVTFSLMKTGYEDVSYTVTLPVAKNGDAVTLAATFYMKKVKEEEPAKYFVAGKAVDRLTYDPISGATGKWTLRGSEQTDSYTTDADGTFKVELPGPGVYDFIIDADGKAGLIYSLTVQQVPAGEEYYFNITFPMYEEGTVEGKTYTLSGSILDENGAPLTGATVLYRHTDEYGDVDVNDEEVPVYGNQFSIENVKKGEVTLFVKKDGFNGWTKTFEMKKFSVDATIPVSAFMTKAENGKVAEVVVPTEETPITIPVTKADPTKDVIAVQGSLVVPENALKEAKLIEVKIDGTLEDAILTTSEDPITDKTAPISTFVTGEFLPSGTTFDKPVVWTVKNPFKAIINGLGLQYSKDGKSWTDEKNVVTTDAKGDYVTELEHFSHYRMVLKSEVALQDTTVDLGLAPFYVNNSKETLKAGEGIFEYTAEEGYKYVVSVEEALKNAGIDVTENADLVTLIEKALKVIYPAKAGIQKKVLEGTNTVDVPVDYVYITSGKQIYQISTYTFMINDEPVKVVVKSAKSTVLGGKIEEYNASHHTHGGHFTNGGTGGGAGE